MTACACVSTSSTGGALGDGSGGTGGTAGVPPPPVGGVVGGSVGVPVVIALNKVDRLKGGHIAQQMQSAANLGDFHALHPVSAKTKDGVGELRRRPRGPLEAEDAGIFFGRDAAVQALLERFHVTVDEIPVLIGR